SSTCAAASSEAIGPPPPPGTSTVIGWPDPSCCAAAIVSHVARLSLPAFCSAMTSSISQSTALDDACFVAQPAHELFGGFGRRAADDLRRLGFLRHVEGHDPLTGRRGRRDGLAHRLFLRCHD